MKKVDSKAKFKEMERGKLEKCSMASAFARFKNPALFYVVKVELNKSKLRTRKKL